MTRPQGFRAQRMHTAEPLPWQQPNATEAFAAACLAAAEPTLQQGYLAYPWASFIDRVRRGLPAGKPPLASQGARGVRASVCQHIWALKHLQLFKKAGITDLFWSHATAGLRQLDGIRIHPFPLYPVRCATHPPASSMLAPSERPLLYSFQGAYAPGLYLTPVRDWLLDLPPCPDALLERRSEWHYEQEVYREQVHREPPDQDRHAQLATEADAYAFTLQRSCFALCPSGSGPNSIRLWEALGYGAIPVILSDQLLLPGPPQLWRGAVLIVPETLEAVAALPSQLEALASDPQRLLAMQQAGQQLWRCYGLNGFATDVVEFLRDPLRVLRSRALQRLPGEPICIEAAHPVELPLLLLRTLRDQAPGRSVLIEIIDHGSHELLLLRWQGVLRSCGPLLADRPAAVVSLVPQLEVLAG
jgi:hypothetical protein